MYNVMVLMSMHFVFLVDPMIKHIILLQETHIQGTHCVVETPDRKPLYLDPMIQHIILPQIGLGQNNKYQNITPYKESTVL